MFNDDVIMLSSDDEETPPVVKKLKSTVRKQRKSNKKNIYESSEDEGSDVVIVKSRPKPRPGLDQSPLKTYKSKPDSVGRSSSSGSSILPAKTIPVVSQRSTSLFESDQVRFDRQADHTRKLNRRRATHARLTAQDEAFKLENAKKKAKEDQEKQGGKGRVEAAERKNEPEYVTIESSEYEPEEPEKGNGQHPSPKFSPRVQETWTDYHDQDTGKPLYVADDYHRNAQLKQKSEYDRREAKNPKAVALKEIFYKRDHSPRAGNNPTPTYHHYSQRSFFAGTRGMEQSEERPIRPLSPPKYEAPREYHTDSRRPSPFYSKTNFGVFLNEYYSFRRNAEKSEDALRRSFYHLDFPDNGPSSSERYHCEELCRRPSSPSYHYPVYAPSHANPRLASPTRVITRDYRREQQLDSLLACDRHERSQYNVKQEVVDDEYERHLNRPRDDATNNVSSWLLQNEKVEAEPVDYDEDMDYPPPKAKRFRTEYITVPPKKFAKPLNREDFGPPPDGIHFNFPKPPSFVERHPVLTNMADAVEKAFPYISEETNCQFKMGEKYPGCEWVWVTVDGSAEDTLNAKYAINEWILKRQESQRPVFEAERVIGKIYVDIPPSIRGLVFGEKGKNIRRLENSKVKILDNRRNSFQKSPPLMITGKIPYVRETYEELKKIIEEAIERKKNTFKVSLKVPGIAIGAIMGFKGENIRKLIEETQVRVELDTRNNENGERTIDLYGEQSQIDAAMAAIQKHVDDSGPCPLDEGVFHVAVPRREVGRLIGNRGDRLRWIAERSSAKCHIVFDENDNATAVCSGGLIEAEFARHLIQVVLRKIDYDVPFQSTDLGNLSKVARHERKHLSDYYLNHPLNGQTYRSKDE